VKILVSSRSRNVELIRASPLWPGAGKRLLFGNLLAGWGFLGKKVQLRFGGDGPPMALGAEPGIERLA